MIPVQQTGQLFESECSLLFFHCALFAMKQTTQQQLCFVASQDSVPAFQFARRLFLLIVVTVCLFVFVEFSNFVFLHFVVCGEIDVVCGVDFGVASNSFPSFFFLFFFFFCSSQQMFNNDNNNILPALSSPLRLTRQLS